MQTFTGIMLFVIIWWMVFFTVLPWGNRAVENPEPGHAASAPAKPRLWLKIAVTTGIAAVLFVIARLVIDSGLIQLGT